MKGLGLAFMRKMSQQLNKRSADPKHPDNSGDADWQGGYLFGRNSEGESFDDITQEWRLRGCPEGCTTKAYRRYKNWKDGYWAGAFSKIGVENEQAEEKR